MWVFDDPRVGLDKEPFVSGADVMMDRLVASVPGAEKGFRLLFSATPFPGFMARLEWRREEHGGNWYYSPEFDMEGWLCPALFKYFETAPKEIYVRQRGKDEGKKTQKKCGQEDKADPSQFHREDKIQKMETRKLNPSCLIFLSPFF